MFLCKSKKSLVCYQIPLFIYIERYDFERYQYLVNHYSAKELSKYDHFTLLRPVCLKDTCDKELIPERIDELTPICDVADYIFFYRSQFDALTMAEKDSVMSDLKLYLIAAEKGGFWCTPNAEERNPALKSWKNGYSCGLAVSQQADAIFFWFYLW